jgi:hypothetical protein
MSMMAFHLLFPEEANNESRTVTPINLGDLPGHTFLFMEFYCVVQRAGVTTIRPDISSCPSPQKMSQ